jgi:hypothetical protein
VKDARYQRKKIPETTFRITWDATPDERLLARVVRGDPEARKAFCERYINAVFRSVRLHFGDHAMAAECAEEVMADFFTEPYPARAAVGLSELPKGALVEADAVMVLQG